MPGSARLSATSPAPSSSRSQTTTQAPGQPYPSRPTRDEGDPARELVRRRGEGELVELERPVFDRVRFFFREGDVAAQGVGAAYDVDCPVDEVSGEICFFGILRGGDEPEARYEDDPGVRVEHLLVSLFVAREVRLVFLSVTGDALAESRTQLVRVLVLWIEVHPQGPDLRPYQVVRAGRADLGELLRVTAADEGKDIF